MVLFCSVPLTVHTALWAHLTICLSSWSVYKLLHPLNGWYVLTLALLITSLILVFHLCMGSRWTNDVDTSLGCMSTRMVHHRYGTKHTIDTSPPRKVHLPLTDDPLDFFGSIGIWGGYSHTWAWWGGSVVMTPVFEIFNPIGSLCYASSQSDWPHLSAEKLVCLYHI